MSQDKTAAEPIYNPWRQFIENCKDGSNYFRSSEYDELLSDLDRLLLESARLAAHLERTGQSVTNDARRDPLQGAADWLNEALIDCTVDNIQASLLIDRDRAKRLFDAATPPEAATAEAIYEGGRESVDDALEVVESFGPGTDGLNDTFARQILLAGEVKRLRGLYESAVQGRADMRDAYRSARQAATAEVADDGAHVLPGTPTRIYLDLGFDPAHHPETVFRDVEEMTWSANNATGHGIPYVLEAAGKAPASVPSDVLAAIRALPQMFGPEIDGEESDGTPKHWRRRPFVSLRKVERLLSLRALPDDASLSRIAYDGFNEYWTEHCNGREKEAWLSCAKAVIAALSADTAAQLETTAAPPEDMNKRYREKCPDGNRCLQGCLSTECCYWDRRAALAAQPRSTT